MRFSRLITARKSYRIIIINHPLSVIFFPFSHFRYYNIIVNHLISCFVRCVIIVSSAQFSFVHTRAYTFFSSSLSLSLSLTLDVTFVSVRSITSRFGVLLIVVIVITHTHTHTYARIRHHCRYAVGTAAAYNDQLPRPMTVSRVRGAFAACDLVVLMQHGGGKDPMTDLRGRREAHPSLAVIYIYII